LDANGIEPKEEIPASRKLARKDAADLAKQASLVVVAKGKKVSEFKPGGKAGKDVVDAMLGPTGNLRAPTIRSGKTLLVGFNEDVFAERLG
jgi:hypothetical protein